MIFMLTPSNRRPSFYLFSEQPGDAALPKFTKVQAGGRATIGRVETFSCAFTPMWPAFDAHHLSVSQIKRCL